MPTLSQTQAIDLPKLVKYFVATSIGVLAGWWTAQPWMPPVVATFILGTWKYIRDTYFQ